MVKEIPTEIQTTRIVARVISWVPIAIILILLVACQRDKESLSVDTPENAVHALNVTCADKDFEGVLALYESTSRQEQLATISQMHQAAEAAGNISQREQDTVALGIVCIPGTEPDLIETNINGSNATVKYTYNADSLIPVIFQIDLVQQGVTWMITDVEFNPLPKR